MLFDFQAYIQELRDNVEKKEVVEKYEKYYGPIQGEIKDQIWYTDYVSKFDSTEYVVPDEIKNDFDWVMLMQLVAASFSSEGMLNKEDQDIPEFVISVQSGEQVVVKKVSELWGFQVLRLFEIYVEEQMNLQILISEEEKEKEAIITQRDSRMKRWTLVLEKLEKEELEKAESEEKDKKLQDLMNKL